MNGPDASVGDQIEQVWVEYKASGSGRLRDQLIVHYSPLVKFVAGRMAAGLPRSVDRADLASYGVFGLIDAIDKFVPDRGFKFETYAIARIKGAIIDELRSVDWVPRSVRAKARKVEKAYATLESELGRAPTDPEVAARLGINENELQHTFGQISFVGLVGLDDVLSGGERSEGDPAVGALADPGIGPVMAYEIEEMKQILASAINRLGEREKMVLTLYYYEGLTLIEIGRVLGVSESRVCQIHTKAILQLRSRIAPSQRETA